MTSPGLPGSARRPDRIFLFQNWPGMALLAGLRKLDDAPVREKNLDHGGVRGLRNPQDGSGREPGEIRGIRLGSDQSIRRPAPVEETSVRGAGPLRPRRSGHHPAGENTDDEREGQPGPPAAPGLRPQEQPDRGHRTPPTGPRARRPVCWVSRTALICRFQRHGAGRSMMQASPQWWWCPHPVTGAAAARRCAGSPLARSGPDIRPGSAADEDGVSRLKDLQADTRQGGRTCSRPTHDAIFDRAESVRLVRTCAQEVT